MFVTFKGKYADLFNDNKQIVRRFHVSNDIVNAQVSGNGNNATVSLTTRDGKTVVYRATGQIVRR